MIVMLFLVSCNSKIDQDTNYSNDSEHLSQGVRQAIIHASIIVDKNFPFINEAVRFWNEGTMDNIFTIGGVNYPIYVQLGGIDIHVTDGNFADGTADRRENYCIIKMKSFETSDTFNPITILEHELGHCLGFAHSDNPNSIMYFEVDIDPTQYITSGIIDLLSEASHQ